jgi:hypothetical protein
MIGCPGFQAPENDPSLPNPHLIVPKRILPSQIRQPMDSTIPLPDLRASILAQHFQPSLLSKSPAHQCASLSAPCSRLRGHLCRKPHYPPWVHRHLPTGTHVRIPGGRGAITGQGELRDKRFVPMFTLNHTCAMLRANINRLFRRTWCTSKKIERLRDHIALYVDYHNRVLTDPSPGVSYPISGGS